MTNFVAQGYPIQIEVLYYGAIKPGQRPGVVVRYAGASTTDNRTNPAQTITAQSQRLWRMKDYDRFSR